MVALRGSAKIPPYQLTEHDEDLQDNPPSTGFAARGKEDKARARALARINDATGLNLTMDDFEVTMTASGDTSRYTPVEWKCSRTVGHGTRERTWSLIIDMDDIPPGAAGNGPDRPHIGYSYWCNGYDPIGRVNGHIFIEYVSASRLTE
jgi:hypothetical protein